jgi:hypothetical protein
VEELNDVGCGDVGGCNGKCSVSFTGGVLRRDLQQYVLMVKNVNHLFVNIPSNNRSLYTKPVKFQVYFSRRLEAYSKYDAG